MAYAPIAGISPQYNSEDYANWWLKAYQTRTVIPKLMALDKSADNTVAKLELNQDGFINTEGGAIVIPYIDGIYDLWLFPTEAEADANDTSNAIQLAEDMQTDVDGTPTIYVKTVAEMQQIENLNTDMTVRVAERTDALFQVTDFYGVINGYNVIASATDANFVFVLRNNSYPGQADLITVINAAQWGMVADGDAGAKTGTDNSPVWQAAIDALPNNGGIIELPNGVIKVETPIDYGLTRNNRISTRGGNGSNGTTVITDQAINALVQLPQASANTNRAANCEFIAIDFNAVNNANYCVQGFGNHMLFRDCRFRTALIAGTDISQGWDNMYDHCYWLDNVTDGFIMTEGQCNQNSFVGCKWVNSGGYGVVVQSSFAINFDNCLFESNANGAVFGSTSKAVSFSDSCYFDRNGQSGSTEFTTPLATVNADIILNGSTSKTVMTVANPCVGWVIDTPFVSGNAVDPHTHIYAISTEGLTVNNASLNSGDISDLVTTYGSTTGSSQYSRNKGLRIGRENDFDNKLVIENSTTGFAGQEDMIIEDIDTFNVVDTNMANWTAVVGGGGTFASSTELHPLGPQVSVYELDFVSASTSSQFGYTLTATDYEGLVGLPMTAVIDVKADASNTPTITFQGLSETRTSSSTDWTRLYIIFNWPSSSTVRFSVKKGSATGKAFIAAPVLARLGTDNRKLIV